MTPEQKQLVRYAEAMGRFPRANGHLVWGSWNPLTDANDALELAKKMDVEFQRWPDNTYYANVVNATDDGIDNPHDTLPAAICAAVDAALGALEKAGTDSPDSRRTNKPKYSFCEHAHATPWSKWHIRRLTAAGLKLGGGADTPALCGRTVAWDLSQLATGRVDADHEFVCGKCAEIYRSERR